ncbi:MAG TPA: hypothetical protein VF456_11950, partial [Vicinamibacterales bacterium]
MAIGIVGTAPGCVVYDAAVTAKNTITAGIEKQLVDLQTEQRRLFRRLARRLSDVASLTKYAVPDPPRWRTHGGDYLYANPYNDALISGDPAGAAYTRLTEQVLAADNLLTGLDAEARRTITARLATIDAADAASIAATNDTGELRFNGRKREMPAVDFLENQVIDPSSEQSATAVLDKISGAALIGARQRQARAQLLTGVVEELLIENKRSRDTESA